MISSSSLASSPSLHCSSGCPIWMLPLAKTTMVALPLPAGHTITVFCRHFRWPPNGRFGPICIIVSDIRADCPCGTVSRLLHVRMHLPILWLHDPPALFDFRISTFLFPPLPPSLALQPDSDVASTECQNDLQEGDALTVPNDLLGMNV